MYGVDWDYHHDLSLINRTSFLLNYLSDIIDGAQSYSDWINGDLYERTNEQFGICKFPGILIFLYLNKKSANFCIYYRLAPCSISYGAL